METVDIALKAFRAGGLVIVTDNPERENEGDLCIAGQFATNAAIAFMLRHGRGLICGVVSSEIASRLKLPPQVLGNNSAFRTPFAVSIDHVSVQQLGVTAEGRATTLRKLADSGAGCEDFLSPGSIFPLIANPAGVLRRQGQTEAAYDLCRLSGLIPVAAICEILADDGTMLRGGELIEYAKEHSLPIVSVDEIRSYRARSEPFVRVTGSNRLKTDFGEMTIVVFEEEGANLEHLAVIHGDIKNNLPLIRIHSECVTGDVFSSLRCDCGDQLKAAMKEIVATAGGVLLYLRQEGRGIGLANKIKAYQLQDAFGLDTVEANLQLGLPADKREYGIAGQMLSYLGVTKVKILTNNPQKISGLASHGIEIVSRHEVICPGDSYQGYLETKKDKMGHLI